MSELKPETERLHSWLYERMKESDFTPSEVAEFTQWLMSRTCDHSQDGHSHSRVSFVEVVSLVSWIKGRMDVLFIREEERSEFTGWLKERLDAHSCLSEEEIQKVHKDFFDR